MITIFHWKAIGYDPTNRFPNGFHILFDYDAPKYIVILTLQHLLGYMPYITDAFPFSDLLPEATLDQESLTWKLNKSLFVQSKQMQSKVIPAGTVVKHQLCHELLFSPTEREKWNSQQKAPAPTSLPTSPV